MPDLTLTLSSWMTERSKVAVLCSASLTGLFSLLAAWSVAVVVGVAAGVDV